MAHTIKRAAHEAKRGLEQHSDLTQPPTVARLRELLAYDPDTGELRWRVGRSNVAAGSIAGCVDKAGERIVVGIDGRMYLAHRVAWALAHGSWPTREIDHRNRNPSDNRLTNLREASRVENARNQKARRNRSGLKGAQWCEAEGLWRSQIRVDGQRLALGQFKTPEEAHAAYCKAAAEHHKEFASHE